MGCPPVPIHDPRFWLAGLIALSAVLVVLPLSMLVISRVGWAALAERYPQTMEPPSPLARMGYCVFRRWCGYNGCMILAADQLGIYMRLWPVFSVGHKPVFIPWAEVREFRRETLWTRPIYRVVTVRAPEIDFAFHGRTWAALRPHAEAARVPIIES